MFDWTNQQKKDYTEYVDNIDELFSLSGKLLWKGDTK